MQLQDSDYQALLELKTSRWWAIVCEHMDEKIAPIERVLLDPTLDEMTGVEDEKKQENLLKYKKMERIHLINLKNTPQNLLDTKIVIDKDRK